MKIQIGDKIEIPNRKSKGVPISKCGAIKRAINMEQPYLYVVKILPENLLVLNDVNFPDKKKDLKGSYFLMNEVKKWKKKKVKKPQKRTRRT